MNHSWYRKLFGFRPKTEVEAVAADAPDHGDSEVQFGLGLKYASSVGAAHDYLQAAGWYLKAAVQSHALAQFNLGMMYANGQGVTRNDATAEMWIRKAADQGDAAAQFNLGVRCQRASMETLQSDAPESKIEAYKWLHLAAAQGYHGSASACERVTLGMTREDVTDGNRRVAAYVVEQARRHPISGPTPQAVSL
jgi:hypothetical protein